MEYTVYKGTWLEWLEDVDANETLVRRQESRQPNGSFRCAETDRKGKPLPRETREWYGANSYSEALALARTGRTELAGIFSDQAKELKAKLPRLVDRFTRYYDVAGGRVDAPRYIAGEPRSMVRRKAAKGTPVVKLAIHGMYMSGVEASHVRTVGAYMVALCEALTSARYSVQIDLLLSQGSNYHGRENDPIPGRQESDTDICTQIITLKKDNERPDLALIGGALTAASTLRVFGFESFQIEAERRGGVCPRAHGYANNEPSPNHDITLWVPYPPPKDATAERKQAHSADRMIETALEVFLTGRKG